MGSGKYYNCHPNPKCMSKKYALLILASLAIAVGSCKKDTDLGDFTALTAVQKQVIKGNNDLSFNLLRSIDSSETAGHNILVSPLSINLTLAMALNGAEGQTKLQMQRVMGLETLEPADINQSYKDLLALYKGVDPSIDLRLANSMWFNSQYAINTAFEQANQLYFNAGPHSVDFHEAASVQQINTWVADATNNKVNDVVSQLEPDGALYLVNASYFHAGWTHNFDPFFTCNHEFFLNNGSTTTVPTMYSRGQSAYFSDNQVQVADLSYANGKYSFVVVLPTGSNNIDNIIADISTSKWNYWMSNLNTTADTKLWLPQIKLEYNASLISPLTQMGLEVAFNNAADFTSISAVDLFINDIKHKTYLEVNEDGTTAAAASTASFFPTGSDSTIEMMVNRPYLIAIREKTSGTILFIGKVENPANQ
jgi:serine protease inhibitor